MTRCLSTNTLLLGALSSLLLAPPALAGIVNFSDTTFTNTDWSLTTVQKNNGGAVFATQSNLNVNTAPWARFVEHSVNAGNSSAASTVAGLHLRTAATYDPSMQGKVDAICFSIDYDYDIPSSGGVGLGALLNQNGKWYAGNFTGVFDGTGFSNYSTGSMNATNFVEVDFSNSTPLFITTSNPDFSGNASVMTFGFMTGNSNSTNNPIQYSRAYHFDDWSISVKSVPEPGTAGVVAGMFSLILLRRRRSV